VRFFGRLHRNSAGILPYGKGFLGNMTENLQADCVQSRQAGFIQRFLRKIPNGLDSAFPFRPCFYYTQEARQTLVRSKTVYRYSPKKSAAK
ncbi:MAG: hypothetical protein UDL61_12335, partial [Ruminococcus callidus]|uniref:hypothetical protein n=1 Tax=Ruminococcus callidus TaxID=40519 RepID=UPI002E79B84E